MKCCIIILHYDKGQMAADFEVVVYPFSYGIYSGYIKIKYRGLRKDFGKVFASS